MSLAEVVDFQGVPVVVSMRLAPASKTSSLAAFNPKTVAMEIVQMRFGVVRANHNQNMAIAGDLVRMKDPEPMAGNLLRIAGYFGSARIFRFIERKDDRFFFEPIEDDSLDGVASPG